MTGYEQFKRDMDGVATFGIKLLCTFFLISVAYVAVRAIVRAIDLPTDTVVYVGMIVVLGTLLGLAVVTLARRAR